MPIYEYRCGSCGERTEQVRAMDAPPEESCPACGGRLARVWGRVGVRFRGWGFSSTDALLPDGRPRRDFDEIRRKAEEITDS